MAALAKITLRQNTDMRKISAYVAIISVPTMIAGIYGMNFRHMPELKWQYGYFLALSVMAATRRVKWRCCRYSLDQRCTASSPPPVPRNTARIYPPVFLLHKYRLRRMGGIPPSR